MALSPVLLLLTEHSNQSRYVPHEIVRANEKGKNIYVFQRGKVALKPELDFQLRPWQWLDITTSPQLEDALAKAEEALRSLAYTQDPPLRRDAPDVFVKPISVIVLEASRHEHEDKLRLSVHEPPWPRARSHRYDTMMNCPSPS